MEDYAKKIEELKQEKQAAHDTQLQLDQRALYDLMVEHDGDVAEVPVQVYRKGLPTMAIVRAPSRAEVKRFQDRIQRDEKKGYTEGLIQVGVTCLLYPDKDTFSQMLERVPSLDVACGRAAVEMAIGRVKTEGKD
jgi:hypothetical protein